MSLGVDGPVALSSVGANPSSKISNSLEAPLLRVTENGLSTCLYFLRNELSPDAGNWLLGMSKLGGLLSLGLVLSMPDKEEYKLTGVARLAARECSCTEGGEICPFRVPCPNL